jgi:light-regulated signal transduction histidine kinase (bacteriophytochrome)
MQVLIEDLLTLSRAGKGGHTPVRVDAEAVVARTLATLADGVRASDARVNVGALPAVLGEAGQLEQLFQNVVGNALKFARPGCAPDIAITAEQSRASGTATFAVRDNGIGLEMRHAERIFTIFQRLHTRDAYPGTGIGLAICKKIVERHGGRIWVESVVGQGTTCRFTLPVAR